MRDGLPGQKFEIILSNALNGLQLVNLYGVKFL